MSDVLVLRPYQLDAVERLRDGIRNGHHSQLLAAPTGAGKTAIGTHLMDESRKTNIFTLSKTPG